MTGDPGAEQLGLALWTGVVVVVFVEIWPEAKRRQYKRPSMLTKRRQTVRPGPAVARPRTRRTQGTNDLNSLWPLVPEKATSVILV